MKYLIILTVLFCHNTIFSQLPASIVSAPKLEAVAIKDASNNFKTLLEAGKQTKQLTETVEIAKTNLELLKNVSSAIKSSTQAYTVYETITSTGKNISNLFTLIQEAEKKGKSQKVIKAYLKSVSKSTTKIENLSKDLSDVLANNVLNMSDANRLDRLSSLETKIERINRKIKRLISILNRSILLQK